MKPLHIGLLIVGAALAGGLAMKMTDLQPVQPVPVAPSPVVSVIKTVPAPAPAVVEPAPPKPSPMARRIAPAPVYVAPVHVAPVHAEPSRTAATHPVPSRLEPVHVEPVVPKSKAVLMAKAAPLPPLLPPVPYEPPPQPELQKPTPVPEPAPQRTATLPPGMTVAVRLDESLSSERGIAGDTFNASLSEPLVVDGLVIAERGAHARGRILGTQRAGRTTGISSLDLELTMVETSDGQKIEISTAPSTNAAASRGKPVNVPSETVIRFRLASRVTITERQL